MASANPAEITGTHRLSEALRDRINVWITLGYPDKATELNIIRKNTKGFELEEAVIEKIRELISRTRNHSDIIIPASVRFALGSVLETSSASGWTSNPA